MKLIYYTRTGNCKRFAQKALDRNLFDYIEELSDYSDGKFILLTPTYGFGEIPPEVKKFLDKNSDYCKAVISSGNSNWGKNFAISGSKIRNLYNIPWILKIEQAGKEDDLNELELILERNRADNKNTQSGKQIQEGHLENK